MRAARPRREGYPPSLRSDVEGVVERLASEGFVLEGELLMPRALSAYAHGHAEYASARLAVVDASGALGRPFLRVTTTPPEVAEVFDDAPTTTVHTAVGLSSTEVVESSFRRAVERVRAAEARWSTPSSAPSNDALARAHDLARRGPLAPVLGDGKRARELLPIFGETGESSALRGVLSLSDTVTVGEVETATRFLTELTDGVPLEWVLRRVAGRAS